MLKINRMRGLKVYFEKLIEFIFGLKILWLTLSQYINKNSVINI